jgi:hypothetical protein
MTWTIFREYLLGVVQWQIQHQQQTFWREIGENIKAKQTNEYT